MNPARRRDSSPSLTRLARPADVAREKRRRFWMLKGFSLIAAFVAGLALWALIVQGLVAAASLVLGWLR